MSANIKASTDGTQAIIGVGGVDQMTVSNAGVVTANSFVGGLNNSSVTATGSTTARSLANRFADVVNVKDFGAVGDGVTDDTAAIANVISSLPSTGGAIYFPSGTYLTNTITIPIYPKCIIFIGDGREISLLKPLNQNQKLIQSAGITSGIGGTRFEINRMGIVPHANGSTGMAIDMRNINYAIIEDFAFIQNGTATFDIGFELYSQDASPAVACYYNTFRDIVISSTSTTGNLPVKQAFKIYGESGNHVIDRLTISGPWPTTTRSAVFIDTYCRHNIMMNSNFEGLLLSGTNTVIEDQGYGNYYFNNYFELTGQPYYFALEIETNSREWCVVEKNAFALGTLNGTTNSLVNGSVWRDNYAFGSDATILAAIQLEEYNTRSRYKNSQLLLSPSSISQWIARSYLPNDENFNLTLNQNINGNYILSKGASSIALQGTSTGGFVAINCAVAGIAGNAITYTNPSYFSYTGNTTGYNGANAAQYVNKNNTTNRSVNAAGTFNASGADYAEYMQKSGVFNIEKGDICGINTEGKLTNVFSESISFVVKSTNPSYVGGDNWFTEENPKDNIEEIKEWESKYQEARSKVDRIAFSGQVQVNVTGATAGQYIVPIQTFEDGIAGIAVSTPTFEQYQISVGKVIAIEGDGRAKIIVKIA